jgi:hypothetical protein
MATRGRIITVADVEKAAGNYTNPKLRERLKNKILAGSRGGKPGQWSARKAQLLAQEYEAKGGGYRGKKGKAQRSLSRWTKEKWTTSSGKPSEGKRRYLPERAWSELTEAQVKATNSKKAAGNKRGKQFVSNTEAAAEAGKRARGKRS